MYNKDLLRTILIHQSYYLQPQLFYMDALTGLNAPHNIHFTLLCTNKRARQGSRSLAGRTTFAAWVSLNVV